MATTSPTKSKKDKREREKEKVQQQHGLGRLKIVVRRLPPNLPEDIFWQSVQTWVTDETATWKDYHQGKFRSRLNKENVPSRAYVAFKTEEQLAVFHREYDGHVFRDKSGNESQAVVEFAPYSKVPSDKKKADARLGTIEQDDDYISFIQSLRQPAAEPATIETLIASSQPAPQPKTTPLLEALKAEKIAAKEAKDRMNLMRSHHAHPPKLLSHKDDDKKKGAGPPPKSADTPKKPPKKAGAATPSAEPPSTGRKPPKAPRAMREQQQQAPPATSNNTPPSTNETTAPPARRTRPILGLGSRQFEAALSGVAGAKPRREREKESSDKTQGTKPVPSGGESSRPKEAGSPKRERRPRDNSASKVQAPIAGILQRDGPPPAILQREAKPAPAAGSTSQAPEQNANPGPPPGLGRGRGRGRGRGGRGGGPSGRGG